MTPDERQWCIDRLTAEGCTNPALHGHYNPIMDELCCHVCHIRIPITRAEIKRLSAARKATPPTPFGPRPVFIPSQHGGKPIPVVPSHSAIAAAMKKAEKPAEMKLDYKTHILIATQYDGQLILLQAWQHVPSQAEIDQVIAENARVGVTCTSYALANPVNCW